MLRPDAIFTKCVFWERGRSRGAIFTYQSFATSESTIASSATTARPRYAWYSGFGSPDIVHSVFTRNSAAAACKATVPVRSILARQRAPRFGTASRGNLPGRRLWYPDIAYSLIEGYVGGVANIDTDPMFVDSAANNFMLMENSPCIDAGDAVVSSEGLLVDLLVKTEVLITPKCPTRAARFLSCAPTLGHLNSNTSLPLLRTHALLM